MPEHSTNRQLGPLLKRLRQACGIGKTEAARIAGVRRMAWYEWETDRRRPRDSNYAGIERALGIAAGSIEAYMTDGTVPVSAATAADTEDPRQVIDRRLRQKRAELVEVLINDDDDPRADEIMTEIQRLVDERNGLSGKDQVSGE